MSLARFLKLLAYFIASCCILTILSLLAFIIAGQILYNVYYIGYVCLLAFCIYNFSLAIIFTGVYLSVLRITTKDINS